MAPRRQGWIKRYDCALIGQGLVAVLLALAVAAEAAALFAMLMMHGSESFRYGRAEADDTLGRPDDPWFVMSGDWENDALHLYTPPRLFEPSCPGIMRLYFA